MQKIRPELTTNYHEPGMKEKCVCGSGEKFKRCCYAKYSSSAIKEYRKYFNAGDYKKALIHARRYFTWYALSHKAHTPILIRNDKINGEIMLKIDMDVLAEVLNNIGICYHHLEYNKYFLAVIDNAANIVDDKRWEDKIACLRASWFLFEGGDEEGGYNLIKNIDFEKCSDPALLTLYLQVKPDKLSQKKTKKIIDAIIENTDDEATKLQYRVLEGINLFQIFENRDACEIIYSAIKKYDALGEREKSTRGDFYSVYSIFHLGVFSGSNEILENCKSRTINIIKKSQDKGFKDAFIKDLHKLLGDIEFALGNFEGSIIAYRKCISNVNKIFLAKSYCFLDDVDTGKDLLTTVDVASLDDNGKYDFAFTWSKIALKTLNASDMHYAKKLLKETTCGLDSPYFVRIRDEFLIEILEAKPEDKSKAKKLLMKMNEYLILNPNMFGIGININKIIDDI